jgi:hypothetical protein
VAVEANMTAEPILVNLREDEAGKTWTVDDGQRELIAQALTDALTYRTPSRGRGDKTLRRAYIELGEELDIQFYRLLPVG